MTGICCMLLASLLLSSPDIPINDPSAYNWPQTAAPDSLNFRGIAGLASYNGDLLVFNVEVKEKPSSRVILGCWDKEKRKEIPQIKLFSWDYLQTSWKGQLILGGNISYSSLGEKNSTSLLAFDGTAWTDVGTELEGTIAAMVVWRGDLVVAGNLIIEGHTEPLTLARFDGTDWHSFEAQPEGGGETRLTSLTVYENHLVVAGLFSRIGGIRANNLASFDGHTWTPLGSGANGLVVSLASFKGQLYSSGHFNCMGGMGIKYLARWNGTQWNSLMSDHPAAQELGSFRMRMLKVKAMPDGLYVIGDVGHLYGRPGAPLHRWNGSSWDDMFPSPARTRINSRRIHQECPERKKGDSFPPSKPRVWTDMPVFNEQVIMESRYIDNLVWHNGRVIVRSRDREGCCGGSGPRIQELGPDGWHTILMQEKIEEMIICNYRDGLLVKRLGISGKVNLGIKNSEGFTSILSWNGDLNKQHFASFHVHGDSIFVVGSLDENHARNFHNISLFDGQVWLPMGDGIAFDQVRADNLTVVGNKIYLDGEFLNNCCRGTRGMLQWDGTQWEMIEQANGGFQRYLYATNGAHLYRSFLGASPKEKIWDEDHILVSFPAKSLPEIQQWTDGVWQTVWQGHTGKISAFAYDGKMLWALVADGIDESVLWLRDGQWEVASDMVFSGVTSTKFNQMSGPVFYDDTLVVLVHGLWGRRGSRLAYWSEEQWQWLGHPFGQINGIYAGSDTLWVDGSRTDSVLGHTVYGMTWWAGSLPQGQAIKPADLDKLAAYKTLCLASDQRARVELNLPWPEGIKYRPKEGKQKAGRWPGWFLSTWADDPTTNQIVQATDDGSIVVDLGQGHDLQFDFFWPQAKRGQLYMEYRVLGLGGWPRCKPLEFSPHPDHPDIPRLTESPHLDLEGTRSSRYLTALDSTWQKSTIDFQMDGSQRLLELVFGLEKGSRYDQESAGLKERKIEIRNLRFSLGSQDPESIQGEIKNHLRAYCWPPEALPNLDNLMPNPGPFRDEIEKRKPLASWWLLDDPGGISFPLPYETRVDQFQRQERSRELSSVVMNLAASSNREYWISGGGLYLGYVVSSPQCERRSVLQELVNDEMKRKFVKGVILDLREIRRPRNLYALQEYEKAQNIYENFAQEKSIWGHVQAKPLAELKTLYVEPKSKHWPDIPVVVIVGEKTPGSHVMVLKAMPNVTVVGQPSASLKVPTRAQHMRSGLWNFFPTGTFISPEGHNVSLCRIGPDITVPEHSSYDTAVRVAMEIIGIVPDPEGESCPLY